MTQAASQYAPVPGKIPGTRVNLGGHEFVIAPLNLDQVQEFESLIPKLGAANGMESIREAMPLILAALQRNYPAFTEADAKALLDMGNLRAVAEAIVDINGLARSSGEPTPASP